MTTHKKIPKPTIERDPNAMPMSAALVNGKYVTYTRVTRDLAVLFFTSADSLVRRFYLIKVIETYSEALYTALWQLGINPDSYGMNYHSVINDFQQHVLYGFMLGILIGMANTDPVEIEKMCNPTHKNNVSKNEDNGEAPDKDSDKSFIPLTEDRIEFLVDLMRDVAFYVESKDFELGLPITNFRRYHELWMMEKKVDETEDEEEEEYYEYTDSEEQVEADQDDNDCNQDEDQDEVVEDEEHADTIADYQGE